MRLLSRLFGGPGEDARPSVLPSQADGQLHTRATELGQTVTTRRELVRMVVRDTLRYCGIPTDWIECQVMVMTNRQGQTHMYATLVLKHWDERLLWHAMALERRIIVELERFEPKAQEWLRGVHWSLQAPDCPVQSMPDADYWKRRSANGLGLAASTAPAAANAGAAPAAEPRPQQGADHDGAVHEDLARLFAVRDAEIAAMRSSGADDAQEFPAFANTEAAPAGFAPTEPHRL